MERPLLVQILVVVAAIQTSHCYRYSFLARERGSGDLII